MTPDGERNDPDVLRREVERLGMYRDIVERANSIILRWTGEGAILFCNGYGLRFFGYAAEELIGKNLIGTILPETEEAGRDLLAMISDLLRNPGAVPVNENQNIRKNGERVWISWSNQAVLDDRGMLVEILSIGREITSREDAGLPAGRERAFLQETLDAIPIPVYYKNTNRVFIGCNKAFEEYLEAPASRIIGSTIHDLAPEKTAAVHTSRDDELFAKGAIQSYDFTDTTPSGKPRSMLFTKTLFRDGEGNVAGLIGAAVDITGRKAMEIQREKDFRFLQQILDAIPIPVYYKDTESRFLGCNTVFAEKTGHPLPEVIGHTAHDLTGGIAASFHTARDGELLRGGGVQTYELTDTGPGGEARSAIFTKTVFRDEAGDVAGLVGAAIDITGRKELELGRERAYRFLQQILDAIPIPVYYKNAELVYLGVNTAFAEYLGLPAERIIGHRYRDFATEAAAGFHTARDAELFETGVIQSYEFADVSPAGKERVVLFTKTLFRDDAGNIAGLVGAAVDITGRKRMERWLRAGETRLLSILERIPAGIFLIDAQTHVIAMMNGPARALTGMTDEECVGQVCFETICPSPPGECPVTDAGGHIENEERILVARDGRHIPVLKSVVPIRLGEKEFLLESVFDISSRKEAEEVLLRAEKLKAAVELAGAASHELNQPLQIISGNAELLAIFPESETEKRAAAIREIGFQVRRMADILSRLIRITHYETTAYGTGVILNIGKSSG